MPKDWLEDLKSVLSIVHRKKNYTKRKKFFECLTLIDNSLSSSYESNILSIVTSLGKE